PFNIYDLIDKRAKEAKPFEKESSIPFPPSFTPVNDTQPNFVHADSGVNHNCSSVKSELLEEMITVGQTMGFSMDGCTKDMEKIIGFQGEHTKENHIISDNFTALYGTWLSNKMKLLIISVYAPQSCSSKSMLWNYLSSLINNWNGESLVMRDFNEVRCKEERWGSNFNSRGANAFNTFISSSGLYDIQLEGYSFTWSQPSASKMSQLDRFLLSNGLFSFFPHISAVCLDRHLSDHRPILLRECTSDFGPILFRFYHSWLDLPDFKSHQISLSNELKSKLNDIEKRLDQGETSDEILLSRMEVLKQLQEIQAVKNCDLMQKAKIRWAIEGDENSKYFHAIINKKRASLSVKGILVDGDWIDDPALVNLDQASELEFSISKEEIHTAVWGCGIDKSLGPDGFTFEFFRKFWDIVGPDFCTAVEWFFEHGNFAKGCNSSFFTLIPKVVDPKIVSDFRPIRLIGSLYKVVTKILVNRLSMVISNLISDVQTAFLPKRQILDGPFIINEILARCRIKKHSAMIFKVDFAKAYDSIRWDFLDDILTSFGFRSKWRCWIRGSLSSGKASILVNGSPSDEFQFYRGLKQGDPLAPFLFLLIMESLHLSLSRAIEAAPFRYLGVLVGENMSLSKAWDVSISKMKNRLSKWKVNALSIGGRLTLLKSLELFLDLLDSVVLSNVEDKISWDFNDEGVFLVKDVRSLLDETFLPKTDVPTRWIKSIPIKVNVFAWKLILDRLPTRSNLALRNINVSSLLCPICNLVPEDSSHLFFGCSMAKEVFKNQLLFAVQKPRKDAIFDDIIFRSFTWCVARYRLPTRSNLALRNINVSSLLCPICNLVPEDSSHLFFGCSMAKEVFKLVCRWWQVDFHSLNSYDGWLDWFKAIRLGNKSKEVLEGVFYVSWWSIWNFRNQLLFAVKKPRKDAIFDDIIFRSFTWTYGRFLINIETSLTFSFRIGDPNLVPEIATENSNTQFTNKAEKKSAPGVVHKDNGVYGYSNAYAHAVKIGPQYQNMEENKLAIMLDETCVNQQDYPTSLIDERVTWVDMEGIPLRVWTKNTFNQIASKWRDLPHVEDQDEGYFNSKRLCIETKLVKKIFESFKIITQGKVFWVRAKEVSGWIPNFVEDDEEESDTDDEIRDEEHDECASMHNHATMEGESGVEGVFETIFENEQYQAYKKDDLNIRHNDIRFTPTVATGVQSNAFKKSKMKGDECLQNIHDEKVAAEVKKTCPLSLAKKAKNDWVKELCVNNNVNFMSLQETKMEIIKLFNIKMCWGEWVPHGKKLLIISVYAPQELNKNKMLWDYWTIVIDNWNGEVPHVSRLQLDMKFPNTLNLDQKVDLENNVTLEEIKKAVWDCGADKSPGPNGFTFGFYHRYWSFLEKDVEEAVYYFFSSEITLILKLHDAKMVKDFRPITLIGSLYKIIAKILANRLAVVLGDIDDPLSPFLFILIIESLHISVQRVVDTGMFRGISMGPSLYLLHLLYANSVVFMGHWSDSSIDTIVKINASKVGLRFDTYLSYVVVQCSHEGSSENGIYSLSFFSMVLIITSLVVQVGVALPHSRIVARARVIKGIHEEDGKLVLFTKRLATRRIPPFKRTYGGMMILLNLFILKYMPEVLNRFMDGVDLVDMRDRWVCTLEGSGEFMVASVRRPIDERWCRRFPPKLIG
nr:RNA-directed DNA polymerase, eukaryota [Tanacetum cinerariifolium]